MTRLILIYFFNTALKCISKTHSGKDFRSHGRVAEIKYMHIKVLNKAILFCYTFRNSIFNSLKFILLDFLAYFMSCETKHCKQADVV